MKNQASVSSNWKNIRFRSVFECALSRKGMRYKIAERKICYVSLILSIRWITSSTCMFVYFRKRLDTTIFDERVKSTSKISRKVCARLFPKTFDFRIVSMSVPRYRRYLSVSWVTKIATSFRSSKLRRKQRVDTTSMSIRPIGGQLGIPTLRLECSKQMSRNRCV